MNTAHPSHRFRAIRSALGALVAAACVGAPACSSDDDDAAGPADTTCKSSGGPVEDGAVDMHCIDDAGKAVTQEVGKCVSESDTGAPGAAGAGGAGSEEEESEVHTTSSAQDDDCKYDVTFSVDCLELDRPATFTVKVTERAGGAPMTGDDPDSPEVYLASNPSHISPSNKINAPEGPPGTYKIGPIVFDESGRWVVRFHFNEECSDTPEDSPHGHVAFYVDVP